MYMLTCICIDAVDILSVIFLLNPLHIMKERILQARILEWVAISFSRRSSWPRDWAQVSYIEGGLFTISATREALAYHSSSKCLWKVTENHTKPICSCQYSVNQVPADFLLPFFGKVFILSYAWVTNRWRIYTREAFLFWSHVSFRKQDIYIINNKRNLHSMEANDRVW